MKRAVARNPTAVSPQTGGNILACPDASDGPPTPSGTARIFFLGRASEGEHCDTEVEDPAPGADGLEFPQHLKTRVFQFSAKSAKVLPPLYMRAALLQKPPELFAR